MDITGNPLVITATDVASVAVIIWTGCVHIWEVAFSEYATQAASCSLRNLNGKEIWFGQGAADLETVRSGHLGTINGGLKVLAVGITNGTMRIYMK